MAAAENGIVTKIRRLVVLSDGTWSTPDRVVGGRRYPSNIVKMTRAIEPMDASGVSQLVFYDEGVGSGPNQLIVGGLFGKGLTKNIADAYRFLAHNYQDGDQLFLFGFSRGAFTVRSLGGMLRKVGLLKKTSLEQFPKALKIYRERDGNPDTPEALNFRSKHSIDFGGPASAQPRPLERVIQCLGVWDTVGALGNPFRPGFVQSKHQFHNVKLSLMVRNAFQALALDETMKPYEPAIWDVPPDHETNGQRVEQTWFPGGHSDVGGGDSDTRLSDISLLWMADRARQCGLAVDSSYLASTTNPSPTADFRGSKIAALGKLLFPGVRKTLATPTEAFHKSVRDRMNAVSAYKPKNGP